MPIKSPSCSYSRSYGIAMGISFSRLFPLLCTPLFHASALQRVRSKADCMHCLFYRKCNRSLGIVIVCMNLSSTISQHTMYFKNSPFYFFLNNCQTSTNFTGNILRKRPTNVCIWLSLLTTVKFAILTPSVYNIPAVLTDVHILNGKTFCGSVCMEL